MNVANGVGCNGLIVMICCLIIISRYYESHLSRLLASCLNVCVRVSVWVWLRACACVCVCMQAVCVRVCDV